MVTHRRLAVRGAVAAALALAISGCGGSKDNPGTGDRDGAGAGAQGAQGGQDEGEAHGRGDGAEEGGQDNPGPQLLGDGSTADSGPQPHQPVPEALRPGEAPPQFIVFSWDGAGEDGNHLFSHFRELGEQYDADMTFFLSGIYTLPESERDLYRPPGHERGASDISFLNDDHIRATLEQVRSAWLEGNEIGTHFNGHFCGDNGVGSWSVDDWLSEIDQATWMVEHWRTTTGFDDLEPLPFDYDTELIGGRAPCLEGQENLLQAASQAGFRYDSSGTARQVWPRQENGVWDLSLQSIPVPGHSYETLSMDYNFMYNQSGPGDGDPAQYPEWENEMYQGLMQAFQRSFDGNRAPLIVGNHFEDWNGGIYMNAVENAIKELCPREGVECVSFHQLVDWLDAQDPAVLEQLRGLDVGQAPAGGWEQFPAVRP
ncbi:hypothetical protein [Streptomyces hoynatensis]|uniref:Lipoprotein n=1 Tax=Streptomyces hoynatensis TaxID=1141874 RepID=A0A3A9Z436_9ACTN|nr:hypothetical protein [Streptomyces hoynatensis]RKN43063.1 hypothetical protein D7294_11205 [Streptomyces hoynatensis]